MRIAMIGTGYVGLVSGACLADFGHHVTCVDKDRAKIEGLLAGRMPIWEPGLESLVKANVERGRLKFTADLAQALDGAEAVFIAVGTPSRRGDGHADLTYVFAAVEELAGLLDRPIVVLTKSAANAFLATKISFINEMADLCEAVDADVQDLARGIGLDNRIGPKFLHAGPGYGGSCFPKDTLALLQTAREAGIDQRIVATTVAVNDDRKAAMVDRVERQLGGDLAGKRVAVLGLAFKPNTDDMREAPAIPLIEALLARGASVAAFDPVARRQAE